MPSSWPIFGVIGYTMGPRTYESYSVVLVESRLESLVGETLETKEIRVDEEIQEQAIELQDFSVHQSSRPVQAGSGNGGCPFMPDVLQLSCAAYAGSPSPRDRERGNT